MYVLKHTYMNVIHKCRYKNAYISHLCVYIMYIHMDIHIYMFPSFYVLEG